jgi:4-amino-4-deoxy-L-arabinose transferase-like glycosyltransferase
VGDPRPLEPVAWTRVLPVADATLVALLALAARWGWHRDELYFREAGRHLAWGFVDQPPFTPFVARLADLIAEDNLVVLRALPALSTSLTVVLGALLVRELGGGRSQQLGGAIAVAGGGFLLGVGHLLSTATFDLTAWTAILLLGARLARTGNPRWWLAVGGVAGIAMLNKNLVVLLVGALVAGFVVDRRWSVLHPGWLVGGGVLALAIAAPNLLWQADHGWPQLDMAEALEARIGDENRVTLLPLQLLFAGPFLVVVLWRGARWLAGTGDGRRFRPLLWAWPVAVVACLASGGRPYYVLPLTITVLLAGIASTDAPGMRTVVRLAVANAAVSAVLGLPILPLRAADVVGAVNESAAEQVGWPQLVDQLAAVVDDLPEGERGRVVLLTGSYGEAGAIDRFGPSRGLPPAHSPHNGYADFRLPDDDGATVVAVRFDPAYLAPFFDRCDEVDRVDNGLDVDNEVQGEPILVCRGLRGTWSEVWEELRFLS